MRKPITAGELMAELQADPKWVAEKEKRDQALREHKAELTRAELPLTRDLHLAGVFVSSAWDLVNTRESYPAAIPVLLEHLSRPYPERIREGIGRALAVPYAKAGWLTVLKAFQAETDTTTTGVKWALALALGAMGADDVLNDVIPLLLDNALGRNRVPLIPVLGRSREPRAREILEQLRDVETIGREVRKALERLDNKKPVTLRSLATK